MIHYICRYGLVVPKKRLDGVMKITNVFGDESDSENEAKNKPIQVRIRTNQWFEGKLS